LASKKQRFILLIHRLRIEHPEILDPIDAITSGHILVDGFRTINPRSLVARHETITITGQRHLRGAAKLRAALALFLVPVEGRISLDVGASTGGFTSALLEAGAKRVYAVDAGHGQLLGSLRLDERVVNLERTNLGHLTRELISVPLDLVVIDLSYLALVDAVPQLEVLAFTQRAHLIALVKPMYELRLPSPPPAHDALEEAVRRATSGIERSNWTVTGYIRSPVLGRHGAVEFFVCAERRQSDLAGWDPRIRQESKSSLTNS
jgi:23S rRNA (cytidine1920-2'-O)/16S rRNA (cytidine1409-2'-O)-methyltransferase